MNEDSILELWARSGYLSEGKFYKYLKGSPAHPSHSQLRQLLNQQESVQITARPRKEKTFSTILSPAPRNNYQMDIMIYDRNEQGGFNAILGCIDVYSRFVMCVPLKSRKQKEYDSEVMRGIRKIFETMGMPKNINTDNEFTSKQFKAYCEKNGIKLWLSYADEAVINSKNAIIERFWRTLANMIRNHTINTGDIKWPKFLDEVVDQYNHAYHSTIKASPASIFEGKAENKQRRIVKIPKGFRVGDVVRLRNKIKAFSKGDVETFSRVSYTLVKKDEERGSRWILRNNESGDILKRGYAEHDLLLVNDVIKPNLRHDYNPEEVLAEVKRRKQLSLELKQLEIDATAKLNKPVEGKRQRKENVRLKDFGK